MVHLRDTRARLKLDSIEAKKLLLDAEATEILNVIRLWNMVAPGTKHRIDPKRPELIGQKEGFRLNVLMHALRNTRVEAALFAGQKCLEIVKKESSAVAAAKAIAAELEATDPTRVQPEEHELVENQ